MAGPMQTARVRSETLARGDATRDDAGLTGWIHSKMTGLDSFVADSAEPILSSKAFQRLYDVTFLGILSPHFSHLSGHPLSSRVDKGLDLADDGSRADHSLAVAGLAVKFCDAFSLSIAAKKYAVAWALIHDIATWPLSHTGEVAFSSITGTTHKLLRHKMVMGSLELPDDFRLLDRIQEMGIDSDRLNILFEKRTHRLDEMDKDLKEFHMVYSLIHSAITPDTLEGIYRSGRAIGINVPDPENVLNSFEIKEIDCFDDAIVRRNYSGPILKFWRQKQKIYDRYINATRTVEFESRWSDAIKEVFGDVSLVESLELSEDEIVKSVSQTGLPPFESVNRYKAPQKYILDCSLRNKRVLHSDSPIEHLDSLLIRRQRSRG